MLRGGEEFLNPLDDLPRVREPNGRVDHEAEQVSKESPGHDGGIWIIQHAGITGGPILRQR